MLALQLAAIFLVLLTGGVTFLLIRAARRASDLGGSETVPRPADNKSTVGCIWIDQEDSTTYKVALDKAALSVIADKMLPDQVVEIYTDGVVQSTGSNLNKENMI